MSRTSLHRGWSVRVNFSSRWSIAAGDSQTVGRFFGLSRKFRQRVYRDFRTTIHPGQVVAITGPSGSGKSVLLRAIIKQHRRDAAVLDVEGVAKSQLTAVELLTPVDGKAHGAGSDLSRRLAVLSKCGLAEATALVRPAKFLSGGQQYRLALAQVFYRAIVAGRAMIVAADEFAAVLDAQTAGAICQNIRRLANEYPIAFVLAGTRTDLLDQLAADRVIVKPIDSSPRFLTSECNSPVAADRLRIVRGTLRDYDALKEYHYLCGPPAAHLRIYAVRTPRSVQRLGGPAVAGVLVVSPPVMCCRGRNVASGGRYTAAWDGGGIIAPARVQRHGDMTRARRNAIARLNAEVECISRVIVHPMYRGTGLAARLVRYAIRRAKKPLVESLAAMGRINPFFQRGGMTPVGLFRGTSRYYSYYLAHRPDARPVLEWLADSERRKKKAK